MGKVIQNLWFDGNVNIAVLNCDSTCTASKELYVDIVEAQQKLNPFKGDHSSGMIEICFF